MKTLLALLLLVPTAASALECNVISRSQLDGLWKKDRAYFQPFQGKTSSSWNGTVYLRDTNKCCAFRDDQKNNFLGTPIACSKALLDAAVRNVGGGKDFEKVRASVLGCLKKNDRACLRPLLAQDVRVATGFHGFGDLRDLALDKWKDQDLNRMRAQLEKGVTGDDSVKAFPLKQSGDNLTNRGGFKRVNGDWVLDYYFPQM